MFFVALSRLVKATFSPLKYSEVVTFFRHIDIQKNIKNNLIDNTDIIN